MTTYEVFVKYTSDTNGRLLTNRTSSTWIPAEVNQWEYAIDHECDKISEDSRESKEVFIIQKNDSSKLSDSRAYTYIIENSVVKNPKFDMIFVYDGLGHIKEESYETPIEIYYDKMKRVKAEPWIPLFKTSSLKVAMDKAEQLVNTYGSKNIKIGKVVPLEIGMEIV